MHKFLVIFISFFFILGTVVFANTNSVNTHEEEISIIGVKMDADWCGKCKVLNPKLNNVMPEFKGEDILFLKFNMTDEFTIQQTEKLAQRLNLSELFEEHKGSTGYMVLLDATTGEVLHTLLSDLTEAELHDQIQSTIAGNQN